MKTLSQVRIGRAIAAALAIASTQGYLASQLGAAPVTLSESESDVYTDEQAPPTVRMGKGVSR